MKHIRKIIWLAALGGLLPLAARAEAPAAGAPGESALVRRIIVFAPETSAAERVSIARTAGGSVVRELELINAVAVELPGTQVRTLEAALKGSSKVRRVDDDPRIKWIESGATFAEVPLPDIQTILEPLKRLRQDAPPTPPPAPPAQETPWGIKRVNAPTAWAATRGAGVKVVVIDTGIDPEHPDLKANIVGGWNAIAKGPDFKDDNGHGTHCAGTIAAIDNASGVVGVAPQVALYGVKVLDADGSGTFDDVIAGMQWAVQNKMQVASMSLGASRGNDSLKEAVEAMAKAGVVLIAAAGNSGPRDNTVGYPAGYPGAIAIAASDSNDGVAWFSSRGKPVALIAPGMNVLSLAPGGGLATMSGTSMATPHVSGLAALAIAAKGLSGEAAVRQALVAAATQIKNKYGQAHPPQQQGAGLVDALKLVK